MGWARKTGQVDPSHKWCRILRRILWAKQQKKWQEPSPAWRERKVSSQCHRWNRDQISQITWYLPNTLGVSKTSLSALANSNLPPVFTNVAVPFLHLSPSANTSTPTRSSGMNSGAVPPRCPYSHRWTPCNAFSKCTASHHDVLAVLENALSIVKCFVFSWNMNLSSSLLAFALPQPPHRSSACPISGPGTKGLFTLEKRIGHCNTNIATSKL